MKIIPIILAGGSGTRLWPLSRKEYPKQFLPLTSDNSMLQETILRLDGIEELADPIILCNSDHRFIAAEQLKKIGINEPKILLEPERRNTAPAIAAAALKVLKDNKKKSLLLVLSSDHLIQDVNAFHKAIVLAKKQAKIGKLTTFGIVPSSSNNSYGYIKLSKNSYQGVYEAEQFVEKPAQKLADLYFEQGNYLWNSGMFMFEAETLINELTIHSPTIIKSVKKSLDNAHEDLDFIRLEEQAFRSSPNDSIDYALMEKSTNVVVVPLDAKWSDVGSWATFFDINKKDNNGNVFIGDVFIEGVSNTYINSKDHMIAAIGVNDLVVVHSANATLISTKDKAIEVSKIVERLQQQNRDEQVRHCKVHRPWGWYDSISKDKYFQVKRIFVNPGAKLSLQSHQNRAEHWVVVKGKAKVVKGNDEFVIGVNQSTYIPIGEKHSLENYSQINPMELIEVQSGTYFGEDDIVRYDDIYERHLENKK